ncbi:trafficking kinesin-binding protein 1 isoform X2 [Melanotaenia boesemani]|uniref:trafficking kinesin-binding protein 1 isoform X2 n=1 Tax=Melanotaenia boesemani TaxID=1250792 RepID=UPI001C04CD36|nr:trafficking kinesin-binding protein 1 isoform X2 [Melanotaenia boesemani]XP_041844648.1 trafficking kinesin-binding protein 1 isoform X2 [Melanotaenia boesemani]
MKRRGQTRNQRFVKADYYELDWYYEECTDVLCADRVGQMTKTYSDIDAVTRLLEEKERDLELAARIGQSLLKKNKALSNRNELLEEQVEHVREEVSQLRHDLSMKDELLQFYTNAAEESEGESITSSPVRPSEPNVSAPAFFPLDSLQKKLKDLEEENKSLRSAATHLETETINYEEKEQQLVNDCVKEIRDANLQISSLAEELAKKTEDASRQQEEITHLLSQIVDLQKKAKLYAVENEELTQHLGAAKDAQRQLTAELRELQDKYAECMEMLHEAQEELKNLRNKTLPLSTPRRFHSLGLFPMDSLAAEIEGTMRKELQMDDPDVEEQRLHPKRVFQTVKNLNLMRQQRSSAAPSPLNIPGSNQTSCFTSGRSSRVGTPRSNSIYGSEMGSGIILDNRTSSIMESPDDGSEDSNKRPPGTPGTPGSRDLEAALRRLSLRRDNYLSEKRFFEEERERKLAYLAKEEEKGGGEDSGGPGTPTESLLSLCSHPSIGSVWSGYSFTSRSYLPEKLQIVKPLEGSATLHAWQQLAQPHMGALLDQRPGVVTKGFRSLAHEHEQEQEQEQEDSWQLDQPEEDEVSCDSFTGFPGENSAPMGPPQSTSTPSVCRNRAADTDNYGQSEGLNEAICSAKEAAQGKDGHVASMPHLSCPSPSSPLPSSSEINGHVDLIELQALQPATVDRMSVHFPGKCMSHTSSTYTFTTCRILHPSDQLTSVSPSPVTAASQSSTRIGTPTHAPSPIPFSAPPTPTYTPCCTPRRLSVSLSLAESSTNLRDSTKTTSTSLGLVRLLLERGISASVYNPCSWDRGLGICGASSAVEGVQAQSCAARAGEQEARQSLKRPDTLFLQPSTPPSSPCSKSASSATTCPVFQFSPPNDDPPYYDAFLASKPARTILREVLGDLERERGGQTDDDDDGQTEKPNLGLVDKLKRFRTLSPLSASVSSGSTLLAPFGSTGLGNSSLGVGLPGLNTGLRRNRSYPVMVGASMAMKDPGGPTCTLLPHPVQTSHAQHTAHAQEMKNRQTNHKLVTKAIHIPQTLHALETVTPQTIVQRHTHMSDSESQDSTRHDQHNDDGRET